MPHHVGMLNVIPRATFYDASYTFINNTCVISMHVYLAVALNHCNHILHQIKILAGTLIENGRVLLDPRNCEAVWERDVSPADAVAEYERTLIRVLGYEYPTSASSRSKTRRAVPTQRIPDAHTHTRVCAKHLLLVA